MENPNLYSELICLVIDGEASEVERQSLFSELSKSPELQVEFQNTLKINNAAKNFASQSTVPNEITQNFFANAGLRYNSPTIIPNNVSPSQSIFSTAKSFLINNSYVSKIAYGLAGFFLGGMLSYFILGNSGDINNGAKKSQLAEMKETNNINNSDLSANPFTNQHSTEFESTNHNLPFLASENIGAKNRVKRSRNNFSAVAYQDDLKEEINSAVNDEVENQYIVLISPRNDLAVNLPTNLKNSSNNDIKILKSSVFSNSTNSDLFATNQEKLGLSIEYKTSSYWNFNRENVFPSEISKFHNMDLFAFYELSDLISLGIGVKQETFYTKYNTKEKFSSDYIYEQQPNITSYEIAGRLFPFKESTLNPYLQLNAGASNYGYTFRIILGSNLQIYDNLGLLLSLDYSSFLYNHKSNWNTTNKIGLNYGFYYQF
ncbi:MAG TPA: hypothetical protein PKY56_03020 [Candidatus Kapabacteria bacterium]|nr:hypothetical protein [Candidatus Kapabacteria bacterium]HPO61668.1 hypothetical protein [Candidatus Kapabacteria bacterium]